MKRLYTVEFEVPEIIVWASDASDALNVANKYFKDHIDGIYGGFAFSPRETKYSDEDWGRSIPFGEPDEEWENKTVDMHLKWLRDNIEAEKIALLQDRKQLKLDL